MHEDGSRKTSFDKDVWNGFYTLPATASHTIQYPNAERSHRVARIQSLSTSHVPSVLIHLIHQTTSSHV